METATYRIYTVAKSGKIIDGQWLEAEGDEDARRKAQERCDAATPRVEVWQGGRFVATLEWESARRAARQ